MGTLADYPGLTEATEASRELRKVQPTLIQPQNDLAFFLNVMRRDDLPDTSEPERETLWVAFWMTVPMDQSEWNRAPSKAAARWIREIRLNNDLRNKFWGETWTGYMNRRLAITLPSTTVVPDGDKASRRSGGAGGSLGALKKKG